MHLSKVLLSGCLALQALLASAQSSPPPDAPAAKPLVYQASGEVTFPQAGVCSGPGVH